MAHRPMSRREKRAKDERRRIEAFSTPHEAMLWKRLERLPDGRSFERQLRIGPYLSDFASRRLMLLIELDGAQHRTPAQSDRDAARDAWLAGQGFRVLRIPNADVSDDLEGVLARVAQAIADSPSAETAGAIART